MSVEIKDIENVVIVGSGPAGYTAALYTSRADLEPLVIEGFAWGGLLQQTTDVENYPGYPEGVLGPQMMQDFREQAERFGTRFITDDATKLELSDEPGGIHVVHVGDQEIRTRAVVLAMGAEPKKLGVPGEDELAAAASPTAPPATRPSSAITRRSWSAAATPRWRTRPSCPSSPARSTSCTAAPSSAPRRSCSSARRTPTTSSCSPPTWSSASSPARTARWPRPCSRTPRTAPRAMLEITGAFIAIGHRPNSQLVEGQLRPRRRGLRAGRGPLHPHEAAGRVRRRRPDRPRSTGRP